MACIIDEPASNIMNTLRLRNLLGISLIAAALCACGGADLDTPAMPVETAATTTVVDLSVDPASVGQTPAPDCAAEGCAGLRIIDGNAEAFRIDAMRGAAQEGGAGA
ncbi:MAG TPA: hypothetical protein DEP03_10990 [Massilia sp.]|nr:hypothetical protein [Massilia sp.]